jgi:two-component system, sensor histidine kinase and response regulator
MSTQPKVPAVDWSRLNELRRMEAEGMPGLATRLVRTYLENSRRLLVELQAAMDAGDADGVRRAAHSVKSTAANIGANVLSQIGRTLEMAAQEPQWRADQEDVNRIVEEHGRVVDALTERFAL